VIHRQIFELPWLPAIRHGYHPHKPAIRDAFRNSAHGVIVKTVAVVDLRQSAAHRYSPAEVVAVAREAVQGAPAQISTSYAERSNLSIRTASRRFTRLTNGFSKKLENHAAAVSLYVAHYNLCNTNPGASRDGPVVAMNVYRRPK
jgi:hypothetical protein